MQKWTRKLENLENLNVIPLGAGVPEIVLLTEMPKYFSWLTISSLRNLVFYSDINGFEPCIRHFSPTGAKHGRVLIHVPSFIEWFSQHSKGEN